MNSLKGKEGGIAMIWEKIEILQTLIQSKEDRDEERPNCVLYLLNSKRPVLPQNKKPKRVVDINPNRFFFLKERGNSRFKICLNES